MITNDSGKKKFCPDAHFGLRIVLIEKLFVNSESEIRNRNQRALLRVCVVNRALEFSSLPSRNFVGLVTA